MPLIVGSKDTPAVATVWLVEITAPQAFEGLFAGIEAAAVCHDHPHVAGSIQKEHIANLEQIGYDVSSVIFHPCSLTARLSR